MNNQVLNNQTNDDKFKFTKYMDLPNTISNKYLCIDLETTGLDPTKGDIIEIYYMIIEKIDEKWIITDDEHKMFWSPLWKDTQHIHHINKLELKYCPLFSDDKYNNILLFKLRMLLDKCKDKDDPLTFMAHYAPFELNWLGYHLNKDLENIKVYDTRSVEKELYPDLSHGLSNICKRRNIIRNYGNSNNNFHRANFDVKAMFEVALQQFEELKNNK